jgi:hypothetical protein
VVKFSVDPDFTNRAPKLRSTGNVVQYLTGTYVATDNVVAGDIVATLPLGLLPLDAWFQSGISNTNDTWILRNSPNTDDYYGVSANGNIVYVIVGDTIGKVMLSEDGKNWSTGGTPSTQPMRDVIWADSKFVSVGESGTIMTSNSGVGGDWVIQTSGTANNLLGIARGASTFVAVGASDTILTSSDGVTWVTQTPGLSFTSFTDITFGSSLFVVCGASGGIATSPDGVTWTERTTPTTDPLEGITFANTNFGVFANAFISCGADGALITSPDAINWTLRTSGTIQTLRDASANDGFYYVSGDNGVILESTDLVNWFVEINPAGSNSLRGFYRDGTNKTLLLVGNSGIILNGIAQAGIEAFTMEINSNQIIARTDIKQNARITFDGMVFISGFGDEF